jgi:hypothetical protein
MMFSPQGPKACEKRLKYFYRRQGMKKGKLILVPTIIVLTTALCLSSFGCSIGGNEQSVSEKASNGRYLYVGFNALPNPPALNTYGAIDGYYNEANQVYTFYMVRKADSHYKQYEFLTIQGKISTIDNTWTGDQSWRIERFGHSFPSPPAFCLNRIDNYPQVVTRMSPTGNRLVHFWRRPNGTWVQQAVLDTQCVGSPAMISNNQNTNLEVVYIDAYDYKLKHIWREGPSNTWHETHALLPLPADLEIYYDPSNPALGVPALEQTDDGIIHAAAMVKIVGRDYADGFAYWMKGAYDVNWNLVGFVFVDSIVEDNNVQISASNTSNCVIWCHKILDSYISGYRNSGGNNPPTYYGRLTTHMPDSYVASFSAASVRYNGTRRRILISFYGVQTGKSYFGWSTN